MKTHSGKALLIAFTTVLALAFSVRAADVIYVADPFAAAIDKFDTNGVGSIFALTSLSGPEGLAYDKSGNLFVANAGINTIEKFAPDGSFSIFAQDPGDASVLQQPQGIAFDSAGNLYVASGSGTIEKFTTNGTPSVFAKDPGDQSVLSSPAGLAFDKSGKLYVANSGVNDNGVYTIEVFTTNGVGSPFITDPGDNSLLNIPNYLAFDTAGNLYVAKAGGVIMKFDTHGVGAPFATNTPANSAVDGMAFDTNGNLYAVSTGIGFVAFVEKFTPSGKGTTIANNTNTGIQNPTGLALDAAGNLSVANNGVAQTLVKLGPDGTFLGATFASIANPQGLALDDAGNLYVANNSGSTIEKFDTNGVGSLLTTTTAPFGLAFDKSGNLFVASSFENAIAKIDTNGDQTVFATNGLNVPQGIAFDSAGNLYAVNAGTNTIVKFDSSGNGAVFGPNSSYGEYPTFDSSSNLFITLANTIQKIAPDGTRTTFFSDPGDSSVLSNPQALAFDSAGNLYVGNENNETIVKFAINGTHSVFATNFFQSISAIAISHAPIISGGGGSLTLQSIATQHINPGQTLVLTNVATDTDPGPPTLTFSLLSTTPTDATLGSVNGVFTWRPLISQASSTNVITVKVTENSAPGASATNSFTVVVNPATPPDIASIDISSGHAVLHANGITGPDYILQTTTNLNGSWQSILTNSSPVPPITITDTNALNALRFYRLQLGP